MVLFWFFVVVHCVRILRWSFSVRQYISANRMLRIRHWPIRWSDYYAPANQMVIIPDTSQSYATISSDCPMRFCRLFHGLAWSFLCFLYQPLDYLTDVAQACTRPLWIQDVALGSIGGNVDRLISYCLRLSRSWKIMHDTKTYHPSACDAETGRLLTRRLRLRGTARDSRVFYLRRDGTTSVRNGPWSARKYLKSNKARV